MKTILIYSGGLDSTTLLYYLLDNGDEVRCLGVDYGQRHKKELECARALCDLRNVEFRLADLSSLRDLLGGSSQTSSEIEVPEGHYAEESMKLTVVPNRNMIMLSVAIGWAVSLKADAVCYAAHAGDHTIYPDCRTEFVDALRGAASLCDWRSVEILTPFIDWTKAQIAAEAVRLSVPVEITWSCYKGLALHCGRCGTCVERREAFTLAGISDPTEYEK